MSFYCVIDTSAFIWDRQKFERNESPYYQLASDLVTLLGYIEKEKPKIRMRNALRGEMVNGFPCDAIDGIPNFRELSQAVYSFLGSYAHGVEEFDGGELAGIQSEPNIVYEFYNDQVKQETVYLISFIHQEESESIYFTFQPLWEYEGHLKTHRDQDRKEYETIISSEEELQEFFGRFKLVFEHSTKHDKLKGWRTQGGVTIAPLSCDNGQAKNDYAQRLLETSIESNTMGGRFNYDDVNQTYVRFLPHERERNKFHGFDERRNDVPQDIRSHYHK